MGVGGKGIRKREREGWTLPQIWLRTLDTLRNFFGCRLRQGKSSNSCAMPSLSPPTG